MTVSWMIWASKIEDGYLRENTGLNGELSAWATVYATEPDKLVEFAYDHNGLRVGPVKSYAQIQQRHL